MNGHPMRHRLAICLLLSVFLSVPALSAAEAPASGPTPTWHYRIARTYPHDRQAFTQGLVYADGHLYEGTGLNGRSSLRKVELASGRVLKRLDLSSLYFGEGITIFGNRIIQITWQSQTGFVYDKTSFRLLKQFSYPHEGWGVTHDGKRLILSDGTSVLHIMDPKDFREVQRLHVHDDQGPVTGLNELEYVKGEIYANIWPTDSVAIIDPQSGRVKARLDLQGLLEKRDSPGVDVLNGIAYDARGDRLFVTGKLWPKVFEIMIVKGK